MAGQAEGEALAWGGAAADAEVEGAEAGIAVALAGGGVMGGGSRSDVEVSEGLEDSEEDDVAFG